MWEVAEIFHRYRDAYMEKYGQTMLPSHRRAFRDILTCRTDVRGGHLFRCDRCGREHYSYHSCHNRSCPKCHQKQTEIWTTLRSRELLPVSYFHLNFTLPQPLHSIVRSHQRVLYDILIKAAVRALCKLARDPHYVGGTLGVLCVLQTWTQALGYHPHVHCLVPAGGLSPDRTHWLPARKTYLVPVSALSRIFRGIFMEMAQKALPHVKWPASVWNVEWVVHSKPTAQGTKRVLKYLARYVHRVAITNSRILSIDKGRVTFRYKDSSNGQWKTMTLSGAEFIRRFLQHVLPKGFHKVRYYGLWSPATRSLLHQTQLLLAKDELDLPTESDDSTPEVSRIHPLAGQKCPHCREGILVWIGPILPYGRAPP